MTTWGRLRGYMVDYADATYQSIQEAAWRWTTAMRQEPEAGKRGFGIEDFLAMSPMRDPFYAGGASDVAVADWFMEVWYQQGMDKRAASGRIVYVRTMHYTATALDALERITPPPPPWGGGRAYENTTNDYEQMVSASVMARYLGYLPFDAIIDNRNKSSVFNSDENPFVEQTPAVFIYNSETKVDEITLPDPDDVTKTPGMEVEAYPVSQRYLLAVVAEKDKVRELIMGTLRLMDADFILASGETSLTQTFDFCKKALAVQRSARVFYLHDYDPAGNDMPMVVARRIEWFVHSPSSPFYDEFQAYLDNGHDITLSVIAITKEQKEQYRLPPTPLKATVKDTRRHWQAQHGDEGVELDQFDRARLDGVLDSLVDAALSPFWDGRLNRRVWDAQQDADDYLAEQTAVLLAPHRERLDALREEYRALYDEVQPKLDAIRDKIAVELAEAEVTLEAAREEAESVVIDEYPVPVAEESDLDGEDALLWTERDYYEQLMKYKEHLGRTKPGKPRREAAA